MKRQYGQIKDGVRSGRKALCLCLFMVFSLLMFSPAFPEKDRWPGVDETVVEKYAKAYGREAREPFINTDQGDLLLFVFLLAGTLGGFVAGYSWRRLMEHKTPEKSAAGEADLLKR